MPASELSTKRLDPGFSEAEPLIDFLHGIKGAIPHTCRLVGERCLSDLIWQIKSKTVEGNPISVHSVAMSIQTVCRESPSSHASFRESTTDLQLSQLILRANIARYFGLNAEKLDRIHPAELFASGSFSAEQNRFRDVRPITGKIVYRQPCPRETVSLDQQRTLQALGKKLDEPMKVFAGRLLGMRSFVDDGFTFKKIATALRRDNSCRMDPDKLKAILDSLTEAKVLERELLAEAERWWPDVTRLGYLTK